MDKGLMHVEDEDGFRIIDPSGGTRGRSDRESNDGIISPPTLRPNNYNLSLHPSMRPSWNLTAEGGEDRASIESSLISGSSGGLFPISRAYEQMRTGRDTESRPKPGMADKVGTELTTDRGRDRVESSLSSTSRVLPRGAVSVPQKSNTERDGELLSSRRKKQIPRGAVTVPQKSNNGRDSELLSSRRKKQDNTDRDEKERSKNKQDDDTLSTNRSNFERSGQQNRRTSHKSEEDRAHKPKRNKQNQKTTKRFSDGDMEYDTAEEGTKDGDRSRKSAQTRQSKQSSTRRRRRKRRTDVDGDNVIKALVVTILSGCCLMDQRDCSEMLMCYSETCDPRGIDIADKRKRASSNGRRNRERRRGMSEPSKRNTNTDTDSEFTRSFTDCGTVTDTTTTASGSDDSRGGRRKSGTTQKSKKKPSVEQRTTSLSPERPPRKTRGRSPKRS